MLEELDIQNFALIDKAHVEFSSGFTVLSGETGAGKSILIGSLSFLLGGKTSTDMIRSGTHEAVVSGTFALESDEARAWLSEHGILIEENRVLLRRLLRDSGKSSAWIGSVPVTRADLAEFAAFLVDLHGQHEQQSLLKVGEHRRYLDSYAGLESEVRAFTGLYAALVEKRNLLFRLNETDSDRANRIELLSFALAELEEAKFKPGEDDELSDEETRLLSYEKLYADIDELNALLDGSDGQSGAVLPQLRRLAAVSAHAASLDKNLAELETRVQSAFYELGDISKEFLRYAASLVFDPERLSWVQERLDLMYRLKKKYASSPSAPLSELEAYAQSAREELLSLTDAATDKTALEADIAALEKRVYAAAKALSAKRSEAAASMQKEVEAILSRLGMKDTVFQVQVAQDPGTAEEQSCGPFGMDSIEFRISANPGSPPLPLAKIASGGELSRVMLALKTILSDGDPAGTLIFDEIDTGIGGEVAVSLGSHMKALASKKQILCITHLASIAVYADNQIKIQKGATGDSTSTRVFPVEGAERVREIARMLSGDAYSDASLEHAAALLQQFGGL